MMFALWPSLKRILFALLLAAATALPTAARADDAAVQTTWRLLDYIAVDYPGAVQDGRIVSQLEYDEMREFSASVAQRLAALPEHPQRVALVAGAEALQQAIARRAPPPEVDRRARALAAQLLAAYPVPLAPAAAPDLAVGERLFAQHCTS